MGRMLAFAEAALERTGMTCNKNGIPGDPEKPTITSGIRLGTAAGTSRGLGTTEFKEIDWACWTERKAPATGVAPDYSDVPRFQGMKSVCPSRTAWGTTSPLATATTFSRT